MFVLDLHRVYQNLNSVTCADLLFTSDNLRCTLTRNDIAVSSFM